MKISKNKLIFLVVYLAYASIYISRVNLSMAGPELIDLGILSTAEIGALGSVFSTVFAIGRLINGGISDTKPPYQMLSVGLGIAGISNLAVSLFPPFIAIFLFWAANAYAQSMLWSSVLCVVANLYDKSIAKKKTSLMVTSVATGNILGIIVNTFLITNFSVRFAFVVPGILTLVLGFGVLLSTRNIENPEIQEKNHKSLWELLKNKSLILMCFPALFHGVMKENISLWMTVYIVDTYFVDLSESAYYILLIPIIGLIGRILYSLIYKLCKENEHSVSLIGFVICILSALLLCDGKTNIILSVSSLGLIYASVSMINTSMLSIYPLHFLKSGNVASVSGMMDFATYLGAGISSVIYGIVIEKSGYFPMFLSWIIISVISIFVIIKVTRCKFLKKS